MTKIAFVRKHAIPPAAPPITEVGAVGWLNLGPMEGIGILNRLESA